jgi:hypothetical protein
MREQIRKKKTEKELQVHLSVALLSVQGSKQSWRIREAA